MDVCNHQGYKFNNPCNTVGVRSKQDFLSKQEIFFS